MSGPKALTRVLDFCRAGYPTAGVPAHGHVPLLALCSRSSEAALSPPAPARRRG